jgi:hypothetical protein
LKIRRNLDLEIKRVMASRREQEKMRAMHNILLDKLSG